MIEFRDISIKDLQTVIVNPKQAICNNIMDEICNLAKDFISTQNYNSNIKVSNNDKCDTNIAVIKSKLPVFNLNIKYISYKNSNVPIDIFNTATVRAIKIEDLMENLLLLKFYDMYNLQDKIDFIDLFSDNFSFIIDLNNKQVKIKEIRDKVSSMVNIYIGNTDDINLTKSQYLFKVLKNIFYHIHLSINLKEDNLEVITTDFTIKKLENTYHIILKDFLKIPYVYFFINFDLNIFEFINLTCYYEDKLFNNINYKLNCLLVNKFKYGKEEIFANISYKEIVENCKSDESRLKENNKLLNTILCNN